MELHDDCNDCLDLIDKVAETQHRLVTSVEPFETMAALRRSYFKALIEALDHEKDTGHHCLDGNELDLAGIKMLYDSMGKNSAALLQASDLQYLALLSISSPNLNFAANHLMN